MMIPRLIAVCSAIALVGTGFWFAQAAGTGEGGRGLPYAGDLYLNGAPHTGRAELVVKGFSLAEGGDLLFTESFTDETVTGGIDNSIFVTDGKFSILLSADPTMIAALQTGGDVWLQFWAKDTEGNLQELKGRQRLGAVPFAYRGAPGADFVVDGLIKFGGNCVASGAAGKPTETGPTSITIDLSATPFTAPPTVTTSMRCSSVCDTLAYSGLSVTSTATQATVKLNVATNDGNWSDINWIAIGPCQ